MRSKLILFFTILLTSTSINLQAQNEETVFDWYPWLSEYVNPDNCNGEKITVYVYFRLDYVYLETENGTYVFSDDGFIYCEPEDEVLLGEPCLERAAINDGTIISDTWDVIQTWECGGIVTSSETIENYLYRNSGEIFFFRIGGTELNEVDLSSAGPFTVFMPTDDAFFNAFPGALQFPFLGYPANFGTTIDNHIVQGNYLITDLFDGQVLTSVTGETLLVTINENGTFINDGKIIEDGYQTTNGILYSIDKVLLVENILGCTEPKALNFNLEATEDDGSCLYPVTPGCNDPEATNYDPDSTVDDGSCIYFVPTFSTNELLAEFAWLSDVFDFNNCNGDTITIYREFTNAFVFVQTAESEILYHYDGTLWCDRDSHGAGLIDCRQRHRLKYDYTLWNCNENTTTIIGCTDPQANNYNASATENDGSCMYDNDSEQQLSNSVFEDFSWLNAQIDATNCNGATVSVYNMAGFQYVFIETNNSSTLYLDDGTYYCTNRSGLDCRAFYNLNNSATVWSCGEETTEEVEQEVPAEEMEQSASTSEILEEFSWLTAIVNETDCNNTTTTVYNKGTFQYIFVETENGGTLYFEDGTKYCTDRSGLNCREFYGLTERTMEWSCGEESGQEEVEQPELSADIFEEFSWLRSVLDDSSCDGTTARVYNTGAFQYVFIEAAMGGTLYFEDGTRYCGNRANLNCEEFYGLEEVADTYVCNGGKFVIEPKDEFSKSSNTHLTKNKLNETAFNIKLYPNPTNNYLNIEFLQALEKELQVTLYDISGKTIQSFTTLDNFKLNLSTQNEGIYLLELRSEDAIQQHKIMKY